MAKSGPGAPGSFIAFDIIMISMENGNNHGDQAHFRETQTTDR
jgi:hypothetical protein